MRAIQCLAFTAVVLSVWNGWTATHYVVPPETPGVTPTSPFTNGWSEAATNIQDAVNAAGSYDTILVSTGMYMLPDNIDIRKPLVVRSWNNGAVDRANTIINGNNYEGKPVTNRCIYLKNALDTVIRGFTLTNGSAVNTSHPRGGGIYLYTGCANTVIEDCLITDNQSGVNGGGIFSYSHVIITNCLVVNNIVYADCAGGISVSSGEIVDTIVQGNQGGLVGGVSLRSGGVIVRGCRIISNVVESTAFPKAGGIYSYNGIIENSEIVGNTQSGTDSGAAVILREGATNILRNCLIANNTAAQRGSGLYIYRGTAIVENCTIVSNRATAAAADGAGVFVIHSAAGQEFSMVNCIVYGNDNGENANSNFYFSGVYEGYISNTCIAPVPAVANVSVADSTDADPLFLSAAAADFRLSAGSPCVNAGTNQPWMVEAGAVDLDGRRRLDRFLRLADMGCYEYVPAGGLFSIR